MFLGSIGGFFKDALNFFENASHPAVQQAAAQVTGPLETLAAQAEPALEAVTDSMADAVLSHIPAGQLGTPFANDLINSAIGKIWSKVSPTLEMQSATQLVNR